ncbi:hypothetical protein, partial [Methylobacterium brachiatum]|uniref:hypothetical protein n=1 Tax=Methylobacterium brachiatum TaxID=269660 RepID=UPI002449EBA8
MRDVAQRDVVGVQINVQGAVRLVQPNPLRDLLPDGDEGPPRCSVALEPPGQRPPFGQGHPDRVSAMREAEAFQIHGRERRSVLGGPAPVCEVAVRVPLQRAPVTAPDTTAEAVVRAVLTALKRPSVETIDAAWDVAISAEDGGTQRASAAREFVAIVDYILMSPT